MKCVKHTEAKNKCKEERVGKRTSTPAMKNIGKEEDLNKEVMTQVIGEMAQQRRGKRKTRKTGKTEWQASGRMQRKSRKEQHTKMKGKVTGDLTMTMKERRSLTSTKIYGCANHICSRQHIEADMRVVVNCSAVSAKT